MNKSTHFSGHPIIKQLLKLIPSKVLTRTVEAYSSDRYYKTCKTSEHLVAMLYGTLGGLTSLRELSTVMLACEGKLTHLNLSHFPKRSTLSDANANRSSESFCQHLLCAIGKYSSVLLDSSRLSLPVKHLKIVDSTTISLFSDILEGVGRNPINGKKKGALKCTPMINALEDVPSLLRFSSAATHDHTFLEHLDLEKSECPTKIGYSLISIV